MKKIISILFVLFLSIHAFSQNQSFKGFYQTKFFNFLGDVKVIEAEFEVKDNNLIIGKLKIGNVTKVLQGQVEPKGKFEAHTEMENGVVTSIKGEFPITKNEGKVSLIQLTEQKGNGSKSSSESGISGFITQMPTPIELKDVGIVDNGKTLLWFQHSNPFFDKEWTNSAAVSEKLYSGERAVNIVITSKINALSGRSDRRFTLTLVFRQDNQKIWTDEDMIDVSYYENKLDDAGEIISSNRFKGGRPETRTGQIEIISENENEIIFKITNLRIKRFVGDDFVQIDGYIHAAKTQ